MTDPDHPIDLARLPATWAARPAGDVVFDVTTGYSSGEYNVQGRGVAHLRPNNIARDGRLVLDELKYVRPDQGALRAARGDVLFNNTNSADLVGKSAPVDADGTWGFSNHITRLRPPEGVSFRFLAYQLQMLFDAGYFKHRARQYVNQASVSTRTLARSVPLIVAPPEEQLRIAAELEARIAELDAVARGVEDLRARLDVMRKRILRDAVTGRLPRGAGAPDGSDAGDGRGGSHDATTLLDRLRADAAARARGEGRRAGAEQGVPPRPRPAAPAAEPRPDAAWGRNAGEPAGRGGGEPSGDPGQPPRARDARDAGPDYPPRPDPMPAGWTWAAVDEVGEVTLGRQRSPAHHYGAHMRPYLRVANVFEDALDVGEGRVLTMNFTPEEYEVYRLEPTDILLNEGQSPELVGRPAMYRGEVPGACFQKTLIRFRAHPGVSPGFALLVFRHYLHARYFQRVAKGSTNIAHLGAARFAALGFPLPPLEEQERIVGDATRLLQGVDETEASYTAALARAGAVRAGYIRRAFSGLLLPRVPTDTPVEVLFERIAAQREAAEEAARAAGRAAAAAQAEARRRTTPTQHMRAATKTRRPLVEVLAEHGGQLTADELFHRSGIGEDLIEEFYRELKEARAGRRIEEVPREPDDTVVYLRLAAAA